MMKVEERLQGIFRKILRSDELVLNRELTAKEVEGWDSLSHLQIVVRIEKEFGIQFKASEVMGLQNVGMLIDLIKSKTPNA